MSILTTDHVIRIEQPPAYNRANPVQKITALVESVRLAAELEYYRPETLQYLFPYDQLYLYGPSRPNQDVLDPARQENKEDFQKQNVEDFTTTDTYLVRGIASAGNWCGTFLRFSYRGGMDSKLSKASNHQLGSYIQLYLKVGNRAATQLITVPYNQETDRYEVELWGFPGTAKELEACLDEQGRAALARGELQVRADLLLGHLEDFRRETLDEQDVRTIVPEHSLHPILPLRIELAVGDDTGRYWDSLDGRNYHYEFNQLLRGWDHYLAAGVSANPHGGLGFLEYRNLFSNYFRFRDSKELGRPLESWNQDAFGSKDHPHPYEPFFAVDYIDMSIMKPRCHIGLHRHRDNQEMFFLMQGQALMVTGDWEQRPDRERALEIRTLRPGHMVLLKSGQLHALINTTDEDLPLLMFGGYD
ncbi:cupin domain-containing protein [Brevibacillus dissolubilis]|uniref:cupin domain-containing protein n=1 Tax=Brevibacillus dissolubilis TaxID=1844116 RepID=UPI00111759F2|nr:cupin domain-containing protein [Brevibacillus dissolubilis]